MIAAEQIEKRADLRWGTIPALLRFAADEYGDDPYLIEGERVESFSSVAALSRRAAESFLAVGVEPSDRVAIWAPNSIDWIVACLGLQSIGATLVPVNTRYRGEEAAFLLEKSGASALVTVTDFLGADYVRMLEELEPELPKLKATIVVAGPHKSGTIGWEEFLYRGKEIDDARLEAVTDAVEPTSLSDIIFTSGTTGSPKGVMLDHGQTLRIIEVWNQMLGFRRGDRYLVLNPFFHVFGYKYGWLCSLMSGVTVYPVAVFDSQRMIEMIESDRITVVPGQPTIFKGLMEVPDLATRDISSLRLSVIGSTMIPTQIVHDMHDVLGIDQVVSGYGLTETNGELTLCRFDDDIETVATTVGRPIDGVEMRIVDPETNTEVEKGGQGEVVARGYNIMRGYFDEPEQTRLVFDEDGWLHTGDIGLITENGSLRLTGRLKDMYIVGGFNVAPAEVEAFMLTHPGIRDVALVGAPDERLGEVGVAFVVPRADGLDPDEVISWCRQRLSNFKVPRFVQVVDALPYNAIGKIQKAALREKAAHLATGSQNTPPPTAGK